MLKTGNEHLESLRDGRRVYIGGELVDDVTGHPAFRNGAASFAMIYDRKAAPENREIMSFDKYFLFKTSANSLSYCHVLSSCGFLFLLERNLKLPFHILISSVLSLLFNSQRLNST